MAMQRIIFRTYEVYNLEMVYSVFAIADPSKTDALMSCASYIFGMNHEIGKVRLKDLGSVLERSKPYPIHHILDRFPYKEDLEKILTGGDGTFSGDSGKIARHFQLLFPQNSWVNECCRIIVNSSGSADAMSRLCLLILILLKTIPKGEESAQRAFEKFPDDLEQFIGFRTNFVPNINMLDLKYVRKNADIGDDVSNIIAGVLHAKALGSTSILSASAVVGHYVHMTWQWYGNKILKSLSGLCTTFNVSHTRLLAYMSRFSPKLTAECQQVEKLMAKMLQIPDQHHHYHCLFSANRLERLGLRHCPAFSVVYMASTSENLQDQIEALQDRELNLTSDEITASFNCALGLKKTLADKIINEPISMDDMDLKESRNSVAMKVKKKALDQNAELNELAKLYSEGDENLQHVILIQYPDNADEIIKRSQSVQATQPDATTASQLNTINAQQQRFKTDQDRLRRNRAQVAQASANNRARARALRNQPNRGLGAPPGQHQGQVNSTTAQINQPHQGGSHAAPPHQQQGGPPQHQSQVNSTTAQINQPRQGGSHAAPPHQQQGGPPQQAPQVGNQPNGSGAPQRQHQGQANTATAQINQTQQGGSTAPPQQQQRPPQQAPQVSTTAQVNQPPPQQPAQQQPQAQGNNSQLPVLPQTPVNPPNTNTQNQRFPAPGVALAEFMNQRGTTEPSPQQAPGQSGTSDDSSSNAAQGGSDSSELGDDLGY
jgi:hypothetical protein